jgi:hypothetical protein
MVTATPSLRLQTSQRLCNPQEAITGATTSDNLPASKGHTNAVYEGPSPENIDGRIRLSRICAPTGGITPEENKKGQAL